MSRNLFFSLILYLSFLSLLPPSTAQQGGGTVVTELWCVAKNNADDAALQGALDWACGVGGADCSRIQQSGPCYDPSDIQKTASFAFNDYYLKHGLTDDACSFSNTAALTSLNPSEFSSSELPLTNHKYPFHLLIHWLVGFFFFFFPQALVIASFLPGNAFIVLDEFPILLFLRLILIRQNVFLFCFFW